MEIHVLYKLEVGEELPENMELNPELVERMKKVYPNLTAISVSVAKTYEDNIKNRLTR